MAKPKHEATVIVESPYNRVVAVGEADDVLCNHVRVDARIGTPKGPRWEEILYWDHAEWEERGTEAFEAIMGVIKKVAAGVKVERP